MNYIPIVMYVYVMISLAVPVIFFVGSSCSVKRVPSLLMPFAPGMLWPNENQFRFIIRADILMVSQALHIAILLTFGIASPALATAVGLVILSELYFNEIFLGRYLLHMKQIHGTISAEHLTTLETNCCDVWRCPKFVIWMILFVSSCFYGLAAFDISSDELGMSLGAAVTPFTLLHIALLWYLAKKKYLENFLSEQAVASILVSIGISGPTSSDVTLSIAENPLSASASQGRLEHEPEAAATGVEIPSIFSKEKESATSAPS